MTTTCSLAFPVRTDSWRVVIAGGPAVLRIRTERSLERIGLHASASCSVADVHSELGSEPTWILRAGAWVLETPDVASSATGKPVLAFGAVRGDLAWSALLARSAGVLDVEHSRDLEHPRVVSVLVERPEALRELLHGGAGLDDAAWAVAGTSEHRAVRAHCLDVGFDEGLRACIAVTALRRGGAERIALDLARALPEANVRVLFVVVNGPRVRPGPKQALETYEPPEAAVRLYEQAPRHRDRMACLLKVASDFGADVIHAHMLGEGDLRALRASIPIVVTIHNDRARWPQGFAEVSSDNVATTLACSWRLRDQLAADLPRAAQLRAAPNFVPGDGSAIPTQHRDDARNRLEIPRGARMVLCVANPRLQKRLDLAVDTVAVLRQRGCDAHLVIVGAAFPDADGDAASRAVDEAIVRTNMERFVRRVGPQSDVGTLYAAADVVLTTSLYEGMSVVQLEALAAGVPVVTTDVGGASEIGRTHEGHYVALATPVALADAIDVAVRGPRPTLAQAFTSQAAAARHARVYLGAATAGAPRATRGLVLVINNFATGGAQASARRLLLELHARGHEVAAVVLQEQPRFPTPWRAELEAALPVFVAPRSGITNAHVAARAVADFVRTRGASRVVFWNAMPLYKLLVADELVGCALYDVSPGEMYFAELERYFAKPARDLPYFDARQYGSLLDGVIVKFTGEAERATRVVGAPVTVIPNGVSVDAVPRTRRPRGERFVIGTLARIAPDKKLEQLLTALEGARGCELRIGGRVEQKAEDHAAALRARAHGLPVAFVGEVDPAVFFDDIDAFAMVSEPAGCPNALLEAMAAGLPVAATDAGGAVEMIEDGVTGLLVPRGDGPALGHALARLAGDDALAKALGRAAHEHVARRFSLARMAEAYERVFAL